MGGNSEQSGREQAATTYREFVRFRQHNNACIAGLSRFLDTNSLSEDACRIYALDCAPEATTGVKASGFEQVHVDNLRLVLTAPLTIDQRRIIIVEDLHPLVVEILGTEFDIDPIFFANHVVTNYEAIEISTAPPSVALAPSQIMSQTDFFNIHFQQVVDFGAEETFQNSPWTLKTSANVSRNVRRLPPISGRQLGIIRNCCSILVKKINLSWIGLIVIDSTTSNVSCGSCSGQVRRIPLHNGIEDFRNPISFSAFRSSKYKVNPSGPSMSLLGVLQDCFAKTIPARTEIKPSVLDIAYHPLRIVVGEWMLYSQVMARYLAHYEYSFKDIESALRDKRDDMTELQKWRHRAIQTQSKIQSTRLFVAHRLTQDKTEIERDSWDLILKDLNHLSTKIEVYGQSLERMLPVVTSMFQLLDSRRSIAETINVRRLTILALVFVPLSWVASLFNMTDDFAPGQSKFWVYFVIAVPLCVVIGGIALLVKF